MRETELHASRTLPKVDVQIDESATNSKLSSRRVTAPIC